ncbi:membrane transporter [Xylariaceae sp. FL0662B]|nr:membrane transporter [Xylariaceae sp. FL0662B]
MGTDIESSAHVATERCRDSKNSSPLPSLDSPIDVERLGRCRPEAFSNRWVEIGFCISVLGSMMMGEFLISGFNVLLPVLIEDTGIDPNQKTWPTSIFSLVTGSLLLPFGRLTDMAGASAIYLGGLIWATIWSLVAGFSRDLPMVLATRALQAVGAAAFLPAGVTLLGTTYRPGPRKNKVFSLYGGCAPFGFFSGIIVAGLCGQFLYWGWFFWLASILLFVLCVVTFFCIPREWKKPSLSSMDWWGCLTSISSLSLLVYSITDVSHVEGHWGSPQIIVTFILGILMLGAFIYVEGWVAESPILPFSLFKIKCIGPLFLAFFIACGSLGIYLFYASFYIETILHVPPLLAALWFAPMAAGGIIIALIGGVTLHLLPGTMLLVLSGIGFLMCCLLFALIPEHPLYWAWVFPAMVCATIGVDISFNILGIFITTNVPQNQQGLAGACINGILFLGISFFLGWADFAVASKSDKGAGESYKVAFWLGAACGGVVIFLVLGFIRVGRAKSDFTVEEKARQQEPTQLIINGHNHE